MHIGWSTLALQTINVLVLVWLLARFLFRPVGAIIAQRRAAAERLLADAATTRVQAETDAAEARQRLQNVSADADRMLAEARTQAEAECTRLLRQATDAAAGTHDEAKAAIENDRLAMEHVLQRNACDLAIIIARRLLQRLPAEAATAALLESLTALLQNLPEERRGDLADAEGQLDVVTATPLDEAQQTACRNLLNQLLGHAPTVAFRTDPTLIAGVELHTSRMLIRNSWQADLERIAGELRREDQHVAESARLA